MFPFSKPSQFAESKSKSEEALRGLLVLGFVGLLGVVFYSFQATSFVAGVAVACSGIMSAGAAALIGGLLGFLFGIPRTLQQERHEASTQPNKQAENLAGAEKRPTYMANTNLEQISDWLTKILVGVGLTQLSIIPTKLRQVTAFIAEGLSVGTNTHGSHTFAFAIVMFYLTCGFLFGYLWTRLFLPSAFREADIDKIVDQHVGRKIDELKEQAEIDANALSLVYHSLNPTTDTQSVKQEELNSAISKASRTVKMQIFYQAQQMRTQNWRNYDDKPKMQLTIPIFRALIASDPNDQFHQNHAQLGYALKDQREPAWAEAEAELSKAIEIKTKLNDVKWPYYEFNRAVCLIHLDAQFTKKEPSSPEMKQRILNDINEATSYKGFGQIVLNQSPIKEWMELNNVSLRRS
jgi:hypothetical protein